MAETTARPIAPAKGKLGVLCVGLGAVATTFIAGVELARQGKAQPIGSLTQLATIRLGKRTENRTPADQGLRAAGRAGRPGLRRLGSDSGQLLRVVPQVRGARQARARRADRGVPARPSSRCRRCSTSTTSSGCRAPTSRRARPSASWPKRCARTSATSRRRTAATGW